MNIGISGHQELKAYNLVWIKRSLAALIKEKPIKMGFSSLAIGSDQLFAEILETLNIEIGVIVPCEHYEKTFTAPADLEVYYRFLKKAVYKTILTFKEPSELAFYTAGQEVVNASDVLIAIWDGHEAKGLGGTADIVQYAIENAKPIIHINPITETIKVIGNGY